MLFNVILNPFLNSPRDIHLPVLCHTRGTIEVAGNGRPAAVLLKQGEQRAPCIVEAMSGRRLNRCVIATCPLERHRLRTGGCPTSLDEAKAELCALKVSDLAPPDQSLCDRRDADGCNL